MKFKISSVEDKKSMNGKVYKTVSLVSETGEQYSSVSVWPDFSEYPSVVSGGEVDGEISQKNSGGKTYTNLVSSGDGIVIRMGAQTPKPYNSYAKKAFVPRPSREAEFTKRDEDRERGISYFNALNNAIEYLKAQGTGGFSLEEVHATQEKFIQKYNSWKYGEHVNGQIKEKAKKDLGYNFDPDEIPF